MPTLLLTDRFVQSAKTPPTRTNYFDTKTRGLTLRVTPNGARSWFFVYRVKGSPSQWMALGTVDGLGLAKARSEASALRARVDKGDDPAAELRTAKAAAKVAEALPPPPPPAKPFTFGDLADLYARVAKTKKKTWRDDVAKIDKYLRPAWGERPLASITRTDVHALLDTLVAAGLTIGVNRMQALVSRLFTIALDRSLIDAHPAARMEKRFKEQAADRTLTDDEIRALWAGLDAAPGAAADAVRLRLLTGQRGGEVAGMRWSEVDLDTRLWSLPAERTKNGRPHTVPLSDAVVAILERRAADATGAAVFPGLTLHSGTHRALAEIHGGAYEWKDLRRTAATRLAELGFDETVIGRCLNHAAVTVTARHYNKHAYLVEKAAAFTAWDAEIDRIIRKAPKPSKVVAHRPRGRR